MSIYRISAELSSVLVLKNYWITFLLAKGEFILLNIVEVCLWVCFYTSNMRIASFLQIAVAQFQSVLTAWLCNYSVILLSMQLGYSFSWYCFQFMNNIL